jgi:hypothetical protein
MDRLTITQWSLKPSAYVPIFQNYSQIFSTRTKISCPTYKHNTAPKVKLSSCSCAEILGWIYVIRWIHGKDFSLWVLVVDKLIDMFPRYIDMFPRYIALWQSFYIRNINSIYKNCDGRDSSVSIETRYRLDGPGIKFRCCRDFPHPSRLALRVTQPPKQWVPGSFSGVNRSGRGVDHPPPSITEVKERVELYLYSPSGPSWPVLGWLFTFSLQELQIAFYFTWENCFLFQVKEEAVCFRKFCGLSWVLLWRWEKNLL